MKLKLRFGKTERTDDNKKVNRLSGLKTAHNAWNAFKRISKDFSAGERAALFHDAAVRVYRL